MAVCCFELLFCCLLELLRFGVPWKLFHKLFLHIYRFEISTQCCFIGHIENAGRWTLLCLFVAGEESIAVFGRAAEGSTVRVPLSQSPECEVWRLHCKLHSCPGLWTLHWSSWSRGFPCGAVGLPSFSRDRSGCLSCRVEVCCVDLLQNVSPAWGDC